MTTEEMIQTIKATAWNTLLAAVAKASTDISIIRPDDNGTGYSDLHEIRNTGVMFEVRVRMSAGPGKVLARFAIAPPGRHIEDLDRLVALLVFGGRAVAVKDAYIVCGADHDQGAPEAAVTRQGLEEAERTARSMEACGYRRTTLTSLEDLANG